MLLLNKKVKQPIPVTKFEILDIIGTIKNLPPDNYEFFIGALVNDYPELADKLQFAINSEFQEIK
jgi:hypothetical protein